MSGSIYMIPTTLGDSPINSVIPEEVQNIIRTTKFFIVENIKTARRYLKKVDRSIEISDLTFFVLNKHTSPNELESFIVPAKEGNNIGIISEAGCPGIADPGSDIVNLAHRNGIKTIPLVGPSSILMALIASGFNGQQFTFHGYLPKERRDRIKKLKEMERSAGHGATQIFMETPFRNNHLLEDIIQHCNPKIRLCIAVDISLESEMIKTLPIHKWKGSLPNLHKRPCMFLIG